MPVHFHSRPRNGTNSMRAAGPIVFHISMRAGLRFCFSNTPSLSSPPSYYTFVRYPVCTLFKCTVYWRGAKLRITNVNENIHFYSFFFPRSWAPNRSTYAIYSLLEWVGSSTLGEHFKCHILHFECVCFFSLLLFRRVSTQKPRLVCLLCFCSNSIHQPHGLLSSSDLCYISDKTIYFRHGSVALLIASVAVM